MCLLAGAAAAGAAGGLGTTIAAIGTAVSAIGSLYQGAQVRNAAAQQSANIEAEKRERAQLSSVEEWRTRMQMRRAMRQQEAQLAERGFDLGSPTALYLAQEGGAEMAFAGGAIRQNASAGQRELSAQQRQLEMRGRNAMMTGAFSAAGSVLNAAPDLWPELLA